ncbi:MAG: hypothetical protein HYT76_10535, partial [Deltaproteobacteria bacterium]|nr:hypothetical protein [Deltaproteobacteria bacterium]
AGSAEAISRTNTLFNANIGSQGAVYDPTKADATFTNNQATITASGTTAVDTCLSTATTDAARQACYSGTAVICNNNAVCDGSETSTNCPADCKSYAYATTGSSNTCGNDAPTSFTQTAPTTVTNFILKTANSANITSVSGSTMSFTWGTMTCSSVPFSSSAFGPVTCTMPPPSGDCVIHLIP